MLEKLYRGSWGGEIEDARIIVDPRDLDLGRGQAEPPSTENISLIYDIHRHPVHRTGNISIGFNC